MSTEEECRTLQQQELEVLDSIYPEYMTNDISEGVLKLEVPVEIESRTVKIHSDTLPEELLSLTVLPSLLFSIILPPQYPASERPVLTAIRATHGWFPAIQSLQQLLYGMWSPGEEVLYTWIEVVRSGEFLTSLQFMLDGTVHIPHPSPQLLSQLFRKYEENTRFNEFSRNSYECSVCIKYQKGSKCLQLSCGHIFCRACLEDFWKLCIKEGDINRVGCPDSKCVKEHREAVEEEVARVVTESELERWRWLKEKMAIEKDPSIIHCPVPACQRPVRPTPVPEGSESSWDKLRTCSGCGYSFCSFCKRSWHGTLNSCPTSASDSLVSEYLALGEDSLERRKLERRYGKSSIERFVRAHQEKLANEKLLEESTMACPGCAVRVEKSMGCNHMTCTKCSQHFCFRCGEKLMPGNPYVHFSTPGRPCYNQLFDGATGREAGIVDGFVLLDIHF